MYTELEGPLNCLDTNKDFTQVVVAGRNVFKILSIEDGGFVERANLRVGKNLNLSYAACDVAWSPTEDHLIASAATNGAVVIWNLNRSKRSKQDLVMQVHKRTVTRVNFHGNEGHMLISASHDSIQLFDLRKRGPVNTFSAKDGVRDVQFSPHHYFHLAAANDSGNVQLWDIRQTDRSLKQFMAHGEPIFTLHWHPEEKNWLATGSRDRTIKVWDLPEGGKVKNPYTIQTIASVARVRWRPQRKHHIASCALLVDFNVSVWDIKRPYIPFASFSEHKDVVTGIVWKNHDPHMFLSSSKDHRVHQYMFKDATRPADAANPVGIDISIRGDVSHSSTDKLSGSPELKVTTTPKMPTFLRRDPTRGDMFTAVNSLLFQYQCDNQDLCNNWFVKSAEQYQLYGRPVEELCEHNAKVAISLNRPQVAQSWRILKLLHTTTSSSPVQAPGASPFTLKNEPHTGKDSDNEKGSVTALGKLADKQPDSKSADGENKDKHGDASTGVSDNESDINETNPQLSTKLLHTAWGIKAGSHGNLFIGDEELNPEEYPYDAEISPSVQEWNLDHEAFQIRTDLQDRGTGGPDTMPQSSMLESPSSANESEQIVRTQVTVPQDQNIKQEILATSPFSPNTSPWDFSGLVYDMLKDFASQGDVQMAVSVLIIFGDKVKCGVDELSLEQWFMSYIDLLSRFCLWNIATEVIQLSNIPAVAALNQKSTTIKTNCSRCGKMLIRAGWLCDRCGGHINTCAVCQLPVKGLYVWCQGCSHGGHLQHIREWFSAKTSCPTGCGHMCEYT